MSVKFSYMLLFVLSESCAWEAASQVEVTLCTCRMSTSSLGISRPTVRATEPPTSRAPTEATKLTEGRRAISKAISRSLREALKGMGVRLDSLLSMKVRMAIFETYQSWREARAHKPSEVELVGFDTSRITSE